MKQNFYTDEEMKEIQGLTLMDDDFSKLMFENNVSIISYILSTLFKKKINVVKVSIQEITANIVKRRVIYDVHAMDDKGIHYNIEMQRANDGAHPKRARYHSASLDTMIMKRNEKDWTKLPPQYVIFFTEKDVLGGGHPIYHIYHGILEMKHKNFGNEAQIIYVNCAYLKKHPKIRTNLHKLIHDFTCNNAKDMYSKEIAVRMDYLKNPESEGFERMTEWTRHYYEKGINQGISLGETSGSEQAKKTIIENLYSLGSATEFISKATNSSVDEINKIISEYKQLHFQK